MNTVRPDTFKAIATPKLILPLKVCIVGAFENQYSDNNHLYNRFRYNKNINITRVDKFDYRKYLRTLSKEKFIEKFVEAAKRVDLMIICKGNGIHKEAVEEASEYTTLYYFMMDVSSHFKNSSMVEMSKYCHYRSCTGFGVAKDLCNLINLPVYHLVHGSDSFTFKPPRAIIKKDIDISFIGGKDEERNKYYDVLKTIKGLKVEFHGPGFDGYVPPKDVVNIYRRSKLVLNISRGNYAGYTSIRLWNIMNAGAFALTKKIKELHLLELENGTHLDSFNTPQELIFKIKYYIDNEKKRNLIAKNGHEFAIKERTWKKTAERILSVVLEYEGYKIYE